MRRVWKGLVAVAAAAAMSIACVLVLPSSASATVYYGCGPNYDPYSYTASNDRHWTDSATRYAGEARLYYSHRSAAGYPLYWVWGTNLSGGDTVSLDWTDDWSLADRNACHRTVASGRTSVTTPAVNQWGSNGRLFRACLKKSGAWSCSEWHTYSYSSTGDWMPFI